MGTDCFGQAQDVPAGSSQTTESARADLLLRSVGTATPKAVTVLSSALDLPREFVVDAIYRAPARLFANLARRDGQRLAEMLRGLGLDAAAVAPGTVPERGAVFDIALVLTDHLRAGEVADALGRFLGTSAQSALELMLTPPGIVLGNVTQPTVTALAGAIPSEAATLIASNPDTARYALFAAQLTPAQIAAVASLLPPGNEPGADGSLSCFDLTRIQADGLWRRLRASEGVRIVNQDFLRFTLVLTAVPADAQAAASTLATLAGVPEDAYPALAAILPCPIIEGVPCGDLDARLLAFSEAGFAIRADLETFAMIALDVRAASAQALAAAELTGPAPLVTPPMPREQARVMRARLEARGAEVLPA